MKQRRPPAHPLPRGLVPKQARTGQLRAGNPLAEWAYRTPAHPYGLMTSELRYAPQITQTELAEYWFRLNFKPFEFDRPWFAIGVSAVGGTDGIAPEHKSPLALLEEEFFGVLPSEIIADLATKLLQEAAEWSPVPPDTMTLSAEDSAAAARAALEHVEEALSRVGPGHNKGPPLDPAITAEIRDAVQIGRHAVSVGSAGKSEAGSAATGLTKLAGVIGTALAAGVAKKAGEEAEPYIKHSLAVLLDHMLQAASALLHWIASIPPGPLL